MARHSSDEALGPSASREQSIHSQETESSEDSPETRHHSFEPIKRSTSAVSKSQRPPHRDVLSRQNSSAAIEDTDRSELVRIATALSRRHSVAHGTGAITRVSTLAVEDENEPALDPLSDQFDLHKWLRNFVKNLQNQGISARQTGVVYKDLNVFGSGAALQVQETVGSIVTAPLRFRELFSFGKKAPKQILRNFDGFIRSGELLIVLGRPGSGCSTLLKTICGELHGLQLGDSSIVHYDGIPQKLMNKEFKGEAIYNQEVDKHFPHLSVGQTLEFAASVRTPSHRINDMSRLDFVQYVARVVMAVFGLSHTYNTKVGNDFVRGVSGGERKRVSIAEMVLSGSPFSAWDNSTRGLDSATAFKFVQALRLSCDISSHANAVAIYQASQSIYDLFDKTTVLYEGRQIYFGPAHEAKRFFETQGWVCPTRQTTGDFLTSVTNPQERKTREGMEDRVPRTPDEFEQYWRKSPEYQALQTDIQNYEMEYARGDETIAQLREQQKFRQAKHVRTGSPYTISILMQVRLCTKRAYQRIWNDLSATGTQSISQGIIALIIGSIFFQTPDATVGFYSKGSVLFMAILMNALTAISEIVDQYAQRPIVEKHASYAFYHPFAEAAAGIAADIPIKFVTGTIFNTTLYFMAGLRQQPANFFLYFLITYTSTFVMSAVFRTMAAVTKTVSQALALSGVLVLALVIYTGFTITVPEMNQRPWFSWIRWINPIYYAFEILVANEFHGRQFTCSQIIPPYTPLVGDSWICSIPGAVAGQRSVSGDAFIAANYDYHYSHVWRNFGILLAFLFGFMILYFVTIELNSSTSSTAEALVFQRGHVPAHLLKGDRQTAGDEEAIKSEAARGTGDGDGDGNGNGDVQAMEPQKDIFTWRDVVYDIEIKGEPRRLLDHVSGWVKPGTLTALMGVSGAGKTTLLDVLAQRTTMGVITGDMLVNGKPLDPSFQRKTGYVQQQDLHLETSTVRESLRFSAMLRQPKTVSKEEKYQFVEEVIKMLNMEDFANAVVGVPGEGLNVEQRKLLTIGVELAAKPKLLLFLDEPTSGLDSQSSWAICAFLRKLANAGQAILCTVHQPSAILFQEFDRLLFLAKGGKTVYFGNIGTNSRTLLEYFESHGARKCDDEENPAEYMLEIVNNGANNEGQDWHSVWKSCAERQGVEGEIDRIHAEEKLHEKTRQDEEANFNAEFAMSFGAQLKVVTQRVFQQYWRMPSYIIAKFALGIAAGLFIGFTFYDADTTQAGLQIVIFSVFMLTTLFTTLVQQIQPQFITQRSLYEIRERPSKAYSWKAFMMANIVVEIPYQIITGILIYACFYYPVIGIQSSARQILVLLYVIQLFIYASAFAQMTIAALPDAQTAAAIVTILTIMSITFSGVLQSPDALPGFWIFMYRVSPFTYWISGIVATVLHGRAVTCSSTETAIFNPPQGATCGEYLAPFTQRAGGLLQNPNDAAGCRYCPFTEADQYLAGSKIFWNERWRNYGIVWAFIFFDIFMAVTLYYVFRVKKWNRGSKKSTKTA